MKLSIPRTQLASNLSLVSRAIGTRHAMQALSGVLFSLDGNGVRVRATDGELDMAAHLEAEAEGEGTILLPGKLLADVVRSLNGEKVELEPRGEQRDVEIRCGASTFHLRSMASEDFPPPRVPDGSQVSLPAEALAGTIETVARAASRDDMRPVLTGVLVSLREGSLTMVATDSYRLSVKSAPVAGGVEGELEANVPARALGEVSRAISAEGVDTVEVALGESQALFRVGGVEIGTVLIEGQFPNYRQLLPESFEHDVRLERGELLEVTRRIGQLAQRNVPLQLRFRPGELRVSASTPDLGDAEETMPVAFEGEELEIGFNPDYLIDGIESVEADEILFRLISPLRPGLIQPVDSDDFRYLVMPIRLNT